MSQSKFFHEISEDVVVQKNPFIESMTLPSSQLPSSGLFYPKDFTIKYRVYSFGELKYLTPKILSDSNVNDVEDYINMCLNGISFNQEFDKMNLCYHDFIYISLLRYFPSLAKSSEDPYDIVSSCPFCSTKNLSCVQLEEIEFNSIEDSSNLILKNGSEEFQFVPLTIRRYLDLIRLKDDNKKYDLDLLILAACVNNSKSILENYQSIYDSTDRSFIENIYKIDDKLNLSILPVKLNCSGCQEEYLLRLDGSSAEYSLAFPRLF